MRGGRQFEPAADNCALQHRHDRQRAELDRLEGLVPRARMQHAFRDAALLQFGEIKARAEMVPIADKHNGLDLFRRSTEPALERKDGFVVQRIALGRPREMHDRDGILQLHMNVGEIICTGGRHRAFLPRVYSAVRWRICRPSSASFFSDCSRYSELSLPANLQLSNPTSSMTTLMCSGRFSRVSIRS